MTWLNWGHSDDSPKSMIDKYAAWVYTCNKRISSEVAGTTLRLYSTNKKAEDTYRTASLSRARIKYLNTLPRAKALNNGELDNSVEIMEHPFLDLWNKVNPFFNGFENTELLIESEGVLGEAYFYIAKDNLGVPIELWFLPGQYMQPIRDPKVFIKGYLLTSENGTKIPFDIDEVIYFKLPNIKDPYRGMSPLKACIDAADQHKAMRDYQKALFQNRAVPEGILAPKQDAIITEDQQKQIEKEWQRAYGGVSKSGKIAILRGAVEYKPLTISPKELEYAEGRRITKEEIAGAYGVPMSLLGVEDVNKANAFAGNYQFLRGTIKPYCLRISQKLNEQLLPMFDDSLFVAYDDVVPEDKAFDLTWNDTYKRNGVLTKNEIRQLIGYEPVEGGDDFADDYSDPFGSFFDGTLSGSSDDENGDGGAGKGIKAHNHKHLHKDLKAQPARSKQRDRMTREGYELRKAVQKIFVLQKDEVKKSLNIKSARTRYHKADNILAQIVLDNDKWNIALQKAVKPMLTNMVIRGISEGMDIDVDREISINWDIWNEDAVKFLDAYSMKFAKKVNVTTERDMRRLVQEAIKEGWNEDILGQAINEKFEYYQDKEGRAEMIARTETARAQMTGRQKSWELMDVKAKKWVAAPDCCEDCQALNGKIIALTDNFYDIGDTTAVLGQKLNYEDVNAPPLHPYCRCNMVAVFDDEITGDWLI